MKWVYGVNLETHTNKSNPATPPVAAADAPAPSPHKLLDYTEVAHRLGVSLLTVKHLAYSGDLPSIKLSARCVRFEPEDLEAFIASKRRAPAADTIEAR